jgi:redox-sensing transcriptional repressor
MVSDKTIGRLSLYRRILGAMVAEGTRSVFSHQLANMAGCTAAQVRRDIMELGYSGTPVKGYDVARLAESIQQFLDAPGGQGVALVGVGNLGKALLAYFAGRRPSLKIVAAFDIDPYKVNRVIHGCRSYPMESLPEVVGACGIAVGIIAVPAGAAQEAAEALVRAGIRGILNFAPVRLRVSPRVYVRDMDMTISLETVAFFARQGAARERRGRQ